MNPARAALIEATKTLLVLRPFGGFSIDEVTREARVARGSFYNHFSDVDELVATTQSLVQAQLNTSIRAAIADSPDVATSMARGMATLMHFGYTSRANARVLMVNGPGAGDPSHPGNEVLTEALRHGIEAGEFALRDVEVGVVVTRGICEFGLSRMIDIHHEFSAVRSLTEGMLGSMLRGSAPTPLASTPSSPTPCSAATRHPDDRGRSGSDINR